MLKAFLQTLTHPNKHKLEHFCLQLLENYNIDTIILFGSTAKGTSNYRSDFDLVIVTDDMYTVTWPKM